MAKKAIVRGPDGKVYVVSKTAPPVQLSDEDTQKITKILADHKKKFEGILHQEIAANVAAECGHNLNLTIPDVSME
jgi:hypothetical protein